MPSRKSQPYRYSENRQINRGDALGSRWLHDNAVDNAVKRDSYADLHDWWGIHYENGYLVASVPFKKAALVYGTTQLSVYATVNWLQISIFHGLTCMTLAAVLCACLYGLWRLNIWYKRRFNPIPIYRMPLVYNIFVPCIALTVAYNRYLILECLEEITKHEFWLQALQKSVDRLEDEMYFVNNKLVELEVQVNESYSSALQQQNSILSKVEDNVSKMWEGFALISITRRHFGLGCFVEGTPIAVGSIINGTIQSRYKNIEHLNETDLLLSPGFDGLVGIKIITMDPEDGFIYNIVTSGGMQVNVTETHPMVVCDDEQDAAGSKCRYRYSPAIGIRDGNWILTVNGYRKVMEVNKKDANHVMVYNVMLDVYPDGKEESLLFRTIVADGIVTGDLLAQASTEDMVKS